ncbi:MAG: type III pantothenate kinase [Candidatus Krumholzibacteriales bacterium]
MRSLLAIDVGNSGLKAAFFSGGIIRERAGADLRESLESAGNLVERFSPDVVAFCSVVPSWSRDFAGRYGESGRPRIIPISSDINLPFAILVESPEKLGADRICAAAGARAEGSEEAVIVDIGTAITIDLLTSEGFRGGSIFPGPETVLDSLSRSASALPAIEVTEAFSGRARPPGRSTEEAISSGVRWGISGAVQKLVALTADSVELRPDIYLTGGGGGYFRNELEFPLIHDPDLIFKGLALISRTA